MYAPTLTAHRNSVNITLSPATTAAKSPDISFSALSPTCASPLSPVTPVTPVTNERKRGLRQSLTGLAIEVVAAEATASAEPPRYRSPSHSTRGHLHNNSPISNNSAMTCTPSSCEFDINALLICLAEVEKQKIDVDLTANGYEKRRKICDTLQGCMYEAFVTDPHKRAKTGFERVAVKQICKDLHKSGEAIQDGLTVLVEEDIIKEAMILKYLTKDNSPNGGYIAKFVEFFETEDHFYLVTEYVGDVNLLQFVSECHHFIKKKQMKLAHYKKVMKFLFWQVCVMVHWMHYDMHCCHLDLTLENIIIRDGTFIFDENSENVSINPNIAAKLADFGLSEIFEPSQKDHTIGKWGLKDSFETTSPLVFDDQYFDGMKADIWSLGAILYKISTGKGLYKIPNDADSGFIATAENKLRQQIKAHRLSKYFNNKMVKLMENMLNVNERERYDALNVLSDPWFDAYYQRYASRINQKSEAQKIQLQKQMEKMRSFPYYTL